MTYFIPQLATHLHVEITNETVQWLFVFKALKNLIRAPAGVFGG